MMTREEAVEALQKFVDGYEKIIDEERVKENGFVQAIKAALAALRPVSRRERRTYEQIPMLELFNAP